MTYELTDSEKVAVVNSHLKNLEQNKYNIELSLIQENALDNPVQSVVDSLNSQLADIASKKTALLAELSSLEG